MLELMNQKKLIDATLPAYYNILERVLNKPEDPAIYKEVLEEFERLRAIVSQNAEKTNAAEFFSFSADHGRLMITFTSPEVLFVEFEKALSCFLGFDDTIVRKTQIAPHKVDIFGNASVIYLYANIVEPIIVGNKKTNLLSVILCTGRHGSVVYYTVPNPRYVPLIIGNIDTIRIELLTDTGDPVPFSWGTAIAVLHFKKMK